MTHKIERVTIGQLSRSQCRELFWRGLQFEFGSYHRFHTSYCIKYSTACQERKIGERTRLDQAPNKEDLLPPLETSTSATPASSRKKKNTSPKRNASCLKQGVKRPKAEEAARQVLKVPPAYTSQTCSACGHRQEKPQACSREESSRWYQSKESC
ncbi:MAG TPA: zinc ribbon domain-containing protein [Ktedonobacteraceae bacterium]|nr:zinc ribbon domain-containing protein [Ktedonobacteraceae bacterium]